MIPLVITIALTLGIGVALLVLLLTHRSAVATRLAEVTGVPGVRTTADGRSAAVEAVSTLGKLLMPVRKAIGMSDSKQTVERLALAGYRERAHEDLFYVAKLLGPVLAGLVAGFVLNENRFFWFIMLAALGFFAPDLWIIRAVSKRRERIRLSVPDAVDLLVICMEAGLGMDQALIRVGEELRISHRELSEEFLLINLEQRAGKPRVEAWRNMAERTELEVVRSFVAMLVQTERFGTPLSRSLSNFADALRTRRRQQAEEMAAKTTIKLVFPLVLFIFPSLFIVLLAPAILTIMKNFGELFK